MDFCMQYSKFWDNFNRKQLYLSNIQSLWFFVCNIHNFLYAIFIILRQFQRYYVISFEKGLEGQRPKVKPHNHRCSTCLNFFYVFRLF